MKIKKEWKLVLYWKKKERVKQESECQKEEEKWKKRVNYIEQFSRDILISSLLNIKIDNKIIYKIKLWLYLLIANYDI